MSDPIKTTIVKGVVPVDFRLIVYGCLWGLFIGNNGLLSFFGGYSLAS